MTHSSISLYLDCISGLSGDMFLGSCVDTGLISLAELQSVLRDACLDSEVEISTSTVLRSHMRATQLSVRTKKPHSSDHFHRSYKDILKHLKSSQLSSEVQKITEDLFTLLGRAEAKSHDVALEDVEFHEVGAWDSLADFILSAYCINKIKPKKVYCSSLLLGRGRVTMAHGDFPIPPPATAELALGFPLASLPRALDGWKNLELTTPTGIALIHYLQPEFIDGLPTGAIPVKVGYGAGTKDFPKHPNVFRLFIFKESLKTEATNPEITALHENYDHDVVYEISFLIDDMTSEDLAYHCDQLRDQGALDVITIACTGKKGRSAHKIEVLASQNHFVELCQSILKNSSTFGLRYSQKDRFFLYRHFETKNNISTKIGYPKDQSFRKEKPEFEDRKKR